MQLFLILLLACGVRDDLTGHDIELDGSKNPESDVAAGSELTVSLDTDGTTNANGPSYDTDTAGTCLDEMDLPPSDLQLTAGPGRIDVVHTGVDEHCCAEWEVYAAVATDGIIQVDYLDVSQPRDRCEDCLCDHDLVYSIEDVVPGTWKVQAWGDSASVEVP